MLKIYKHKKHRFTWLSAIKLSVMLILAGVTVYLYVAHMPHTESETALTATPTPTPTATPTVEATYITETSYDGSKELNPILFHFPFKKTDFYITNKELVKQMDNTTIQKLQEDVATFVTNYFQLDSKAYYKDYDNALENFQKLFVEDSYYCDLKGNLLNTKQYTDDFVRVVCNSRWQTQVEFETDNSLVWQDNAYYVRGYLTIHIYKLSEDADLSQFFPFDIHSGKDIQAVVDIGVIPGIDNYQITTINYIWLPEEV